MSRMPYYDSLVAAGLIEADYAFTNGTLYDIIGGRVVTPGAASRLQRNGLATDLTTNNISSGNVLQNVTEGTVMCLCTPRAISAGVPAESLCFASDMNNVATAGFILSTRGTLGTIRFVASSNTGANVTAEGTAGSFVIGKKAWFSGTFKNDDTVKVFLNGVESGSASYAGRTKTNGEILYIGNRAVVSRRIAGLYARLVSIKIALTEAQQQTLQAELDSLSYPTSVYEIRPPQYPTIKDGTPASTLETMTPSITTAVYDTKDSNMAPYKQFTRTLSSSIDYGIQTQNQLNAEFEWDGCVYFDTDSVGQAVGIVKIGDVATGVSWGLQKSATEKFQFVYGADATVDFAYSVPSLGPLHIVLRREFNGSDWDLKLWVNGEYKETLTGAYAGTGNASAKTILGANLSGRIYYSNIYQHLRPIEKFQRDPFDKNMTLGWGIRASTILDNVETDTDGVVRVISGGANFKVNAGRGTDGKLEKFLETTAAGATFYIRNVTNGDGVKLYYRTTGTLEWTEGDGSTGVTVAADGLFTMPATTQFLWARLG